MNNFIPMIRTILKSLKKMCFFFLVRCHDAATYPEWSVFQSVSKLFPRTKLLYAL